MFTGRKSYYFNSNMNAASGLQQSSYCVIFIKPKVLLRQYAPSGIRPYRWTQGDALPTNAIIGNLHALIAPSPMIKLSPLMESTCRDLQHPLPMRKAERRWSNVQGRRPRRHLRLKKNAGHLLPIARHRRASPVAKPTSPEMATREDQAEAFTVGYCFCHLSCRLLRAPSKPLGQAYQQKNHASNHQPCHRIQQKRRE